MKLPGQYVLGVCEVPFGGYPSKHPQGGLPGFQGYGEDYEFIAEAKAAADTEATLQAWIDTWVLGCRDHEALLRKVGAERLLYLKGKIQEDSWEAEFRRKRESLFSSEDCTPQEMAIVVGARGHPGQGQRGRIPYPPVRGRPWPTWPGGRHFYQLREAGVDLDIMAEAGMFGYAPRPGDPATFNSRNFPSCKMLTDIHHVMGLFAGGSRNRCIGSLGRRADRPSGQHQQHRHSRKGCVYGRIRGRKRLSQVRPGKSW